MKLNFEVPLNTSQIYLKHVLYDGCQLWVPLLDETKKKFTKLKLKNFNAMQMANDKPGPRTA